MKSAVFIKSAVKAFLCGVVISTLGVGTMLNASAGTTSGGTVANYSVGGNSYSAQNIVATGTSSNGKFVNGITKVTYNGTGDYFAGMMGSYVYIKNDYDVVVSSNGWYYNNTASKTLYPILTHHVSGGGYYTQGKIKLWNGNGYDEKYPGRSPSLSNYD